MKKFRIIKKVIDLYYIEENVSFPSGKMIGVAYFNNVEVRYLRESLIDFTTSQLLIESKLLSKKVD